MNKLVAIGDIHGLTVWRDILEKEQPTTAVFIGDYFDSYDISGTDQIHNFKNIIQWKLDNPQCQVVMLIGNHDYHYFSSVMGKTNTSGFQRALYPEINKVLEDNKHHLQMAFQYDDLVFSHAGISPEFLANCKHDSGNIVDTVNDLWLYKPLMFNFTDTGWGHSDPYGDDTYQTPIWIRPKSLMKVGKSIKKQFIQVVGHTKVEQIDPGKATGGRYYFIDCLDTSGEYLTYENKQIKINRL
jgi:hypothetical protein